MMVQLRGVQTNCLCPDLAIPIDCFVKENSVMRSHPRWFLLEIASADREYLHALLIRNRYHFECHSAGFLVFTRSVTRLAQYLTTQGIRSRTALMSSEAAVA